ncbi:MAG TPA: transketolase family protein [Anaerovoracaceae bacterium]|nr:transketolase family protein [Anaerovoracaceae bacterium]
MAKEVATRVAYGDALIALGQENEKVVVLDADVASATFTYGFSKRFPECFFNMGIAEANMVGVAAGLADMGFVPFASTFAVFGAGRAYDQVRNTVAYSRANVKLPMTHSGITAGEDGGSHHAIEDIALMRVIPGMVVLCPCDETQTHQAVRFCAEYDGPVYLRLSRMASSVMEEMPFRLGGSNVIRDGSDVVLFACGLMVDKAVEAARNLKTWGIDAAVINLYSIKPIDREMVKAFARKCGNVVTLEEHSIYGGLGDAVSEALSGQGCVSMKRIGVRDMFGQSGKPEEVLKYYRLDGESVTEDILAFLATDIGKSGRYAASCGPDQEKRDNDE